MLNAEQRSEFDRYGMVRMPGAIAHSAVEEMLGIVWDCLRDRHHIHRGAPETWPEPHRPIAGAVEQIGGAHRFMGTHHLPKSMTFAQVGNVAPPLLLVPQLPYSVLPLANVSTCRIAPMFGSFST